MHCHVWHAQDFSQNFVFLCIHFHTHILSLNTDNLVQEKKIVYMCIMMQRNKKINFVKLLKNKSLRHSQSKSQLSHLLQKHKIASLF